MQDRPDQTTAPDQGVTARTKTRQRFWIVVGIALICWLLGNLAAAYYFAPEALEKTRQQVARALPVGRQAGFHRREYIDSDGIRHKYVVFVPEHLPPNQSPPVILYLNGKGKNGSDGLAPLLDGIAPAVWEVRREFPFVVVWPQCPEDDSWSGDTAAARRAVAILQEAAEEFQTDPDRVSLTGLSSGGSGVWSIAANHPDLFAAIVPISAGAASADQLRAIIDTHLPVWMFSVENDGSAGVVQGNRDTVVRLLKAGQSPRHTEVLADDTKAMYDHDAWSYAYRTPALFDWLLSQRRSARSDAVARFDLQSPDQFPAELNPSETPLLGEISARNLRELHLEFRPAEGAASLSVGSFHPAERSLGRLVELALADSCRSSIQEWPDRQIVALLPPAADQLVLVGRWNDLRLKFSDGQVTVDLNGWTLPAVPFGATFSEDERIGFRTDGRVELRNLRVLRADNSSLPAVDLPASRIPDAGEPPLVTVTDILGAWQKRAHSVPTIKLRWRTRFSSVVPSEPTATGAVSGTECTTSELHLTADRVQTRTAWRHPQARVDRRTGLIGEPNPQEFLQILNGGFVDQFAGRVQPMPSEVRCLPTGRRDELLIDDSHGWRGVEYDDPDVWRERIGNLDDLVWRAPLLALNPLAAGGWVPAADACKILPEYPSLAGVNCVVLEETTDRDGQACVRRFWLDPLRGLRAVRATVAENGVLRERIDLEYQDRRQDSLPAAWTVVTHKPPAGSTSPRYFPGNALLFECAASEVVEIQRPDQPEGFDVKDSFRSGTLVFRPDEGAWSRQVGRGQRRPLSSDEVASIRGALNSVNGLMTSSTYVMAGGILALAATGIIVRRRRRAS